MAIESTKEGSYTTVRMTTIAHTSIVKEAKRFGLKNIDYLDAAVNYFALRGLNPVEVEAREGTLIMQQMNRLGDRLFAYMQEEERGILMPMLEELIRIRLTTERVLRLEELVLSTLPEDDLLRRKEKVDQLREQNDTAIKSQVHDIFIVAKSKGPGKKVSRISEVK
ncbi:hypothetical protein [Adhaeribacter rhizoryzae]|uniref:Uncharacterized protein n=1 Tax=Adhaeribacter rhizoryzae TaxID=2607907 RepID=A0A5M6CU79_9BACT|nr:hypothetical protein [Adhaeribacter rhizoryzae]KAA5538741.1 hypothetical protein F0145_25705 [Adhaeribacter rhizoryzae]